ncbi:MAG: sulfatase-like hydrolase/transferase, partial [Planctomycetes bacterium]|nr:sulfatase-like hydrolase/transferase [Planctomycetota bacterium]
MFLRCGRVFFWAAVVLCVPVEAAERPNVLLIFTDDQGWGDVSCYHSEIPTPHIDSLARDGAKFTSWYAASSICTPSRFGLLTGRYPSRSRDRLLGALMRLWDSDADRGIRAEETTVAEVLQKQGYGTALIGKWHLGHGNVERLPLRHGFESFYGHASGCVDFFTMRYGIAPDWYRDEKLIDETGYATDLLTDEAVRFLHRQETQRPFFLYLAYNAPHYGKGYDPGKREVTNILQARPEDLARVEDIEDPTRRVFAAMVRSLDDGIGRVLAALKERGIEENTLVVFMTDHGGDPDYGGANGPLRGEKATLFEGGIRVPCLMRWPGRIRPGIVHDFVGSGLDLFPTFCRLAGVDPGPYRCDGVDLSQYLFERRGKPPENRELFWELAEEAALRSGPWKYVRTADGTESLFNL